MATAGFKVTESCSNSALQFSSLPSRDVSFAGAIEQSVDCGLNLPLPVDNLSLKFPLGNSNQYLDGLQVAFKARFQIRNADGSKLTEDKDLAPTVGIAGGCINRCEVWSGGVPRRVYNMYAYMYHILNLCHRGVQWFQSLGSVNGFIPDDTSVDPDVSWTVNKGLVRRREWAQKSKEFEVCDSLLIPFFLQTRLIPLNNQEWSVILHLNKSEFTLTKKPGEVGDFKLYLLKAELLVTKINLTESASQTVNRFDSLLIPYIDYEIQSFSLGAGILQRNLPMASLDKTPKRFFFVLVSQDQAAGTIDTNPYAYSGYDIESLSLDVGGRLFAHNQMELTSGEILASSAYHNLVYKALGKTDGDFLLDIRAWSRMKTIFAFDTTNNHFSAECEMLTTQDQPCDYSVSLKFRTKLAEPLQLLVLTETERVLSCARNGGVTID